MAQRKILGIDPGSRNTGYAILVEDDRTFTVLECDTIKSSHISDQTERLRHIYETLAVLVERHRPGYCAVETPVYGIDPLAMLKLGRAQAAAMLAVSNKGLSIVEYYPKTVKKAVTGNGNASKKQVAYMLGKMVRLPEGPISADASDALAVAWCHCSSLDRPGQTAASKKTHQNNRKPDWKSFIENNPDRVKT